MWYHQGPCSLQRCPLGCLNPTRPRLPFCPCPFLHRTSHSDTETVTLEKTAKPCNEGSVCSPELSCSGQASAWGLIHSSPARSKAPRRSVLTAQPGLPWPSREGMGFCQAQFLFCSADKCSVQLCVLSVLYELLVKLCSQREHARKGFLRWNLGTLDYACLWVSHKLPLAKPFGNTLTVLLPPHKPAAGWHPACLKWDINKDLGAGQCGSHHPAQSGELILVVIRSFQPYLTLCWSNTTYCAFAGFSCITASQVLNINLLRSFSCNTQILVAVP